MKREDVYQILGIIIVVVFFLWENRKVTGTDKVFLWILFASIIVLFFVLNMYSFLKTKLDLVDKNSEEILKLKEQISFRKTLEELNYKIGKLEKGGKK